MLGSETVVVVTEGTDADPYSGDVGTTGSEVEVPNCLLEPRPSGEPRQDARNAVVSGFTVYMPPGTEIGPQNRLRARGGTFSVLGEPAVWRFGEWEPGIVVQCERTEG